MHACAYEQERIDGPRRGIGGCDDIFSEQIGCVFVFLLPLLLPQRRGRNRDRQRVEAIPVVVFHRSRVNELCPLRNPIQWSAGHQQENKRQ